MAKAHDSVSFLQLSFWQVTILFYLLPTGLNKKIRLIILSPYHLSVKRRNAGRKSFEIYIRKSRTESPERGKDSLANKEANHPLQTGKLASPDRVGH